MADQEHLEILKQGVSAWNSWRSKNPMVSPDLSGADLRESPTPRHAHSHRRAILIRGPKVRESRETHARGASLREANLTRADLSLGNFTGRVSANSIFKRLTFAV